MKVLKWLTVGSIANLVFNLVFGIMYGNPNPDLEGPAILVIAFGVPYVILRFKSKKEGMATRSNPEWIFQDDKWLYSSKYGRDPEFAIATDDIKDYMEHVKKTGWESYNWSIERKINTRDVANYNYIDTEVSSVIIKNTLGQTDHLFFVLPGPKRSGHVPEGYEWVDNGVEHDKSINVFPDAQPIVKDKQQVIKEQVTSQQQEKDIEQNTIESRDETISKEIQAIDINEEIPYDSLKKLKRLYDEGVLSETEYKNKKKELLGI